MLALRYCFVWSAALFWSLAGIQGTAQITGSGIGTYRANSRLVIVDVVATDSKGNPIRDLKAEDFTVFEDGVRMQASSFTQRMAVVQPKHSALTMTSSAASQIIVPPNPVSNTRNNFVPDEAAPGINLLLLDALNTEMSDQEAARAQMIQLLRALPPRQRIGVFLLGRHLRMVQGITGDSASLIAAVDKLVPVRSPALATGADMIQQENDLAREESLSADPATIQMLRQMMAEDNAAALDTRVSTTLDTLAQISRAVAGYPGRKNLIWVSGAFPFTVDPDFRLGVFAHGVQRNYGPAVREVTNLLATSQIAVYPVDVRGLLPTFPDSTVAGKVIADEIRKGTPGRLIDQNRRAILDPQDTMRDLAQQTGGKAFVNTNDLAAAVGQSIALGSEYYSLSYVPRNVRMNGKFRHIEVKVARKGVTLAYRRGYYAFADEAQVSESQLEHNVALAMERETLGSTALALQASVDRSAPGKLVVNYLVSPSQISTRDDNGRIRDLAIDFFVVGWDDKGRETGRRIETVRVPPEAVHAGNIEHAGVTKRVELEMKPGTTQVRVGVMDRHTGRIGTVDF
jgi:VWFA-related protein